MKKKIDAQKNTCHVVFSLPKEAIEEGTTVVVVGDFNEWTPTQLNAQPDGSFEQTIEIPTGRDYHFRYRIGDRWENDWDADRYELSPMYHHIYNSVLSLVGIKPSTESKTKKVEEKPKAAAKAPAKAAPKAKVAAPKAKVAPAKPAVAQKDDLTKIEGIGPKIAGLLNADGIITFAQLSKTAETTLQAILDRAGKRYQIHKPTTWAAQAKMAADGNWDALKKWQDELNGGKIA